MSTGSITDYGPQAHRTPPRPMLDPGQRSATSPIPREQHASLSESAFGDVSPIVPRQSCVPRQSWYIPGKRWVESVFAVVLLALASPVIIVAAVLVKLTSR